MASQVALKLEKEKGVKAPDNVAPVSVSSQDTDIKGDSMSGGFFGIPLKTLRVDTIPGFNIYLHFPGKKSHVLYRSGSVKFTEEHKEKLTENRIVDIFIKTSERQLYTRYVENHLPDIISDHSLPTEKKSEMVYHCSTNLLQDVFQRTRLTEKIPRVSKMVKNTVEHLFRTPGAFVTMLDVMSHDYYTVTHSVNVCVIGVALGQKIGLKRYELNELGAGLLLHDLGKSKIDDRILRKNGPLNEREWKIVKHHPKLGADIAALTKRVPPLSITAIKQHHEKCSGKGYPMGLHEPQIHLFGRIAAIADVYDALTSERPYGSALAAFPAIKVMQKEMENDFSPLLFKQLVLLLNEKPEKR
ncbi:MAG: HD domain-containing protein [Deltaproteobacteria bacterium]|nr:HD domain-containing protein [Deltaproteobacteria bacterium]